MEKISERTSATNTKKMEEERLPYFKNAIYTADEDIGPNGEGMFHIIGSKQEKEKLQKESKDSLKEDLKGTKIFMTKGEKKIDATKDEKAAIEEGLELTKKFKEQFKEIDGIYASNKTWKKVFSVSTEIIQNVAGYAIEKKPIIFEIKENQENGETICKIETLNYFEDKEGTKTKILQQRLDEVNELSKGEIGEKYKEQLEKGTIHAKGGAGLGFLDIGKRLKDSIDKPYTYSFQKDKNGLVRFKLLINIPLKESLIPIKKAHILKEIDNARALQIEAEDELAINKNNEEAKAQQKKYKNKIAILQKQLQ